MGNTVTSLRYGQFQRMVLQMGGTYTCGPTVSDWLSTLASWHLVVREWAGIQGGWKTRHGMSEPKRWMLSRNCCSLLGDFNLERKSVTKSLFVDVVTGHPEVGQEKGTLLFTGISLGSFRKSLFTPGASKLIRAILWTKLLTVIALYEKVRRLEGSSIIWGETICRASDAADLGMQRTQHSTMSSTQLYISVGAHNCTSVSVLPHKGLLSASDYPTLLTALHVLSPNLQDSQDKHHYQASFQGRFKIIVSRVNKKQFLKVVELTFPFLSVSSDDLDYIYYCIRLF